MLVLLGNHTTQMGTTVLRGPLSFISILFASALGGWVRLPALPNDLGEVGSMYIQGKLYAVGEADQNTYVFDTLAGGEWTTVASRPLVGNHHASVLSPDGRWWLIGGLDGGSEGMVGFLPPCICDLVTLF